MVICYGAVDEKKPVVVRIRIRSKVRCIARPDGLQTALRACLYVDAVPDAYGVVCGRYIAFEACVGGSGCARGRSRSRKCSFDHGKGKELCHF